MQLIRSWRRRSWGHPHPMIQLFRSDRWDVLIGRDRKGFFHASSAGCIGQFKEAAEWINWESGLDDSQEAARLLEGKWGYSQLVKELRS